MVPQTNQICVCGMYGRVPEHWWYRSAASMVTQTNQIYVYMQIVRGRLGEIYVYIALQASPTLRFVSGFHLHQMPTDAQVREYEIS